MRKYLYWEERRGDGKKLDEKNEEEEDGGYVKTTGLNKTRETDKQTNKQKQLLNAHAFFSTISPFYLFMHWGWQGSGSDEKIDCGTNCRFVPFVKCFRFQFSRFYCRRALKGLKQGKCSRSSQKLAQLSLRGEQGVFGWARRVLKALLSPPIAVLSMVEGRGGGSESGLISLQSGLGEMGDKRGEGGSFWLQFHLDKFLLKWNVNADTGDMSRENCKLCMHPAHSVHCAARDIREGFKDIHWWLP